MNLSVLCLLCISFYNILANRVKPRELVEKLKLKVVKKGDGKTYPLKIAELKIHTKYYSPPSMNVYDDTFQRNTPLTIKLGRNRIMKCWEEILPYVSLNEWIFIICPWDIAFGEGGAFPWVPPKTDAPFEIQVISIDEDPEWHYTYNRERKYDEL